MLIQGKRLAVFSIKENKGGSVWTRAGNAFVNRDGSLNIFLDVNPIDGRLHVREAMEKKKEASPPAQALEAFASGSSGVELALQAAGGAL